jgi:hypothetical protein
MQVLTEAARQLALACLGRGSARAWQLTGLTGSFGRFAELDAVTMIRAAAPVHSGDQLTVPATVTQDGEDIASLTVTLTSRPEVHQ